MKKSIGFYTAMCCAVLSLVTFVVLAVYGSKGGQVTNVVYGVLAASILCELASFAGEKPWTDFTSILGAAGLAYVLMKVLSDGIWNIAEAVNGIKMLGKPELASMNYLLLAVNLVAIIFAVIAAFQRKSKA